MKKLGMNTILKKWWLWALIVVIVLGSIEGMRVKDNNSNLQTYKDAIETASTESDDNDKEENQVVTYETFKNIAMGETYDEVINSIGEGKEISSSITGDINSSIYLWQGKGISTVTVTFENNIVTGKSQAGLLEADTKYITKEKYDSIKNNMTYDNVKEIIGEGQILSHTKLDNIESITYGYINKDGSNANITFNDDRVILKAQFNLK